MAPSGRHRNCSADVAVCSFARMTVGWLLAERESAELAVGIQERRSHRAVRHGSLPRGYPSAEGYGADPLRGAPGSWGHGSGDRLEGGGGGQRRRGRSAPDRILTAAFLSAKMAFACSGVHLERGSQWASGQ